MCPDFRDILCIYNIIATKILIQFILISIYFNMNTLNVFFFYFLLPNTINIYNVKISRVNQVWVGSRIDICMESEISEQSSKFWLYCCIYFHTNTVENGMNAPLPSQGRLSSLTLSGNQSKRRKTLNSKPWRRQQGTTSPCSPMFRNSQIIKKRKLWRAGQGYGIKKKQILVENICILLKCVSIKLTMYKFLNN